MLESNYGRYLDEFKPDFIIYNAGTDCLRGDPLGALSVSPEGIAKRDEIVFGAALERKIPLCMLPSGGYTKENAEVITNSILDLDLQFNIRQVARDALKEGAGAQPAEAQSAEDPDEASGDEGLSAGKDTEDEKARM